MNLKKVNMNIKTKYSYDDEVFIIHAFCIIKCKILDIHISVRQGKAYTRYTLSTEVADEEQIKDKYEDLIFPSIEALTESLTNNFNKDG